MTPLPQFLRELEEKARAATPGPWKLSETILDGKSYGINGVKAMIEEAAVCTEFNHGSKSWTDIVCTPALGHATERGQDAAKNMEFIAAANPETVLRLIDIVRKQDEALTRIRADLSPSGTIAKEALSASARIAGGEEG